jgi:hypothetical protein
MYSSDNNDRLSSEGERTMFKEKALNYLIKIIISRSRRALSNTSYRTYYQPDFSACKEHMQQQSLSETGNHKVSKKIKNFILIVTAACLFSFNLISAHASTNNETLITSTKLIELQQTEETTSTETGSVQALTGTLTTNSTVTALSNGHFEVDINVSNTDPLVLIKGISGTVSFYDTITSQTVSYDIYSTQWIPYSQFYFYRNYSTGFTSGHLVQVYVSYHIIVFQGTLDQYDFWGRVYVNSK